MLLNSKRKRIEINVRVHVHGILQKLEVRDHAVPRRSEIAPQQQLWQFNRDW
jgi:hypothetical protein